LDLLVRLGQQEHLDLLVRLGQQEHLDLLVRLDPQEHLGQQKPQKPQEARAGYWSDPMVRRHHWKAPLVLVAPLALVLVALSWELLS
jgi:hypothetical protein